MELMYYGANCLTLTTKNITILIDPITSEYGPDPKVAADVVLFSQLPKQSTQSNPDFVIDRPGEYEIKGVTIDAVAARLHTEEAEDKQDGVMYAISHKDLRVLICGNIHPNLSEEQVERIDGIDVLVVPVGGKGLTLDKEAASDLVRQFDPSYVVPVHYEDSRTVYPVPQDTVEAFLQEVGSSDAAREDSLKITARDASEETTFIVLQPRTK
ncbi:MAG: MBL fold metallo-hydrolase [Candidatus Saccharimonadales bacterium]